MNTFAKCMDDLHFKLRCADYHYALALTYMSKPALITEIVGFSDYAEFGTMAEFVSFMTTVHAALDMLAQAINASGLPFVNRCNTGKVTFKTVSGTVSHTGLLAELVELRSVTRYLDAFVNITKHQNVIHAHTQSGFLGPGMMYEETYLESFKRNGVIHDAKDLSSVLRETYEGPLTKVREVASLLWQLYRDAFYDHENDEWIFHIP